MLIGPWGLVVRRVPLSAAQVARISPPVVQAIRTPLTHCGAFLADLDTSGKQSLVRK